MTAIRDPREWAGRAQAYAASFAHLCAGGVDPLLTAAGVIGGTPAPLHLLDVGTGAGAVASRAVALGVRVTAVDPDPGMLALAAAAAPGAEVRSGTLPDLPFETGTFDVVVANFVLNVVAKPRLATGELVRVAATGGRVAVTVWPADRGALGDVWAATTGAAASPSTDLPPEDDFARTPDGLRILLADAGLDVLETVAVSWTLSLDPERLWSGAAAGVASIGRTVTAAPPAEQARMRQRFDRAVEPMLDAAGLLALPLAAVLGVGVRR